jgi:hypothetical protein
MSVASSVMSTMSVVSDGRVVSLEEGLDHAMNSGQKLLNNLHLAVREINKPIGFEVKVEIEDSCVDDVIELTRLLKEIPAMATRVRSVGGATPAECKAWYKNHKDQRKIKLKNEKEELKAATTSVGKNLNLIG